MAHGMHPARLTAAQEPSVRLLGELFAKLPAYDAVPSLSLPAALLDDLAEIKALLKDLKATSATDVAGEETHASIHAPTVALNPCVPSTRLGLPRATSWFEFAMFYHEASPTRNHLRPVATWAAEEKRTCSAGRPRITMCETLAKELARFKNADGTWYDAGTAMQAHYKARGAKATIGSMYQAVAAKNRTID